MNAEGYVYFIQAGKDGPVKIGWAKNPAERVKALQTGSAARLTLVSYLPGGRDLEAALHRICADVRLDGEWFKPSAEVMMWMGIPRHQWPTLKEDGTAMTPDEVEAFEDEMGEFWASHYLAVFA